MTVHETPTNKRYTDEQKMKALELLLNNYDPETASPPYKKVNKTLAVEYKELYPDQTPSPTVLKSWWNDMSPALKQRVLVSQAMVLQSQTRSLLANGLKKLQEALPRIKIETADDFKSLSYPLVAILKEYKNASLGAELPLGNELKNLSGESGVLDMAELTSDEEAALVKMEIDAKNDMDKQEHLYRPPDEEDLVEKPDGWYRKLKNLDGSLALQKVQEKPHPDYQ